MTLYGIDRSVLNMFYPSKVNDIGVISDKLRITLDYARQICDCLVEAGFLEQIGGSEYRLASGKIDKGKPRMKSTDHFVRH